MADKADRSETFSMAFILEPKNARAPNFIKIAICRLSTKIHRQLRSIQKMIPSVLKGGSIPSSSGCCIQDIRIIAYIGLLTARTPPKQKADRNHINKLQVHLISFYYRCWPPISGTMHDTWKRFSFLWMCS